MSHSTYRELMAAAMDAPLPAADRAALDEHLQTCAACRAAWEAVAKVDALLRAAPAQPAPAGFAGRTAARLAGRASRPRLVGGGLILAFGSAALLAVLAAPLIGVGLALLRQPDALVALARALTVLVDVAAAVGGGLALAMLALLDLPAGLPLVGGLLLSTVPLAGVWLYFFQRLSPKAVTL